MKKNLKQKKKKFDWFELRRQIFHAVTGIVILFLLVFNILNEWVIASILVFGFILFLINRRMKLPIIWWFIRHFERKENMKEMPGGGSFFYILGIFISLILFPRDVAYVAIIVLALGDSVSTFIGKNYGRTKVPWSNVKLLEGTLAGMLLSFIGFLSLYFLLPGFSVTILEGLLACIVAMMVEALEMKIGERKLDDNLLIPLVAGAVIMILRGFF